MVKALARRCIDRGTPRATPFAWSLAALAMTAALLWPAFYNGFPLVFFDTGRSELVRVDHFDIVHPFLRVREHLERLGQGAWVVECLTRLTADRDPQPALFGLVLRSLRALESGARPQRVATCFGLRAVDLLGHRPRIDRCVDCGRAYPFPGAGLDVLGGGLLCADCGPGADALDL